MMSALAFLFRKPVLSLWLFLFLMNFRKCLSSNSFLYEIASDCIEQDKYYNFAELQCKSCEEFTEATADKLSCKCKPGYRQDAEVITPTCLPCPDGEITTDDGYECIPCSAANPISANNDECTPCDAHQIPEEYGNDGILLPEKTCTDCLQLSQPNPEKTECTRCDPFVIAASDSCTCNGESAGGMCFPSGTDLIPIAGNIGSIIPLDGKSGVPSIFIIDNYAGAVEVCEKYSNLTACQLWGNICVMQMYVVSGGQSPCGKYRESVESSSFNGINGWKENMPWLYYTGEGENIATDIGIDVVFSAGDNNKLDVLAAMYRPNGTYLGLEPTTGGVIQFCQDTPQRMDAAYEYGQNFKSSCTIKAQDFWDKYETTFFDLYLQYRDNDDILKLFPIPLLVTNYAEDGKDNSKTTQNDWQLTRRFFLVDNVAGKTTKDSPAQLVRYAKNIILKVVLQNEDNAPKEGKIYPPLLIITYADLNYDTDYSTSDVEVTFEVLYELDQGGNQGSMTLSAIILAVPALLYAALKTTAWRRRAGRLTVDVPAFVKFFAFASGLLADMLFVIVYGSALFLMVFYKRQSVVKLLLPTPDQEGLFVIFIIGAFVLKLLDLIHMVYTQCTFDIFFIDWERPKGQTIQDTKGSDGKDTTNPVSIWRTYFVANEWNEIQTSRRSSPLFQICSVLFFLEVLGFKNICTYDIYSSTSPDTSEYISEDSRVLRFAMATTLYLVIGSFQWIFFTFIYERFVENSLQNFVDLCSMANISIFVLANHKYGYYIHGRSVHGFADTSMKHMREQLKREEDNLCGQRGLLPNSEEQTFEMQLPERMREQYDRILLPLANAQGRIEATRGRPGGGGDNERFNEAYVSMNKFLSAFIDHGLRDIDYQVKDKLLLERILDMEFSDSADQGFLYNDDGHSFDRVIFAGNEITLLLFEVLLFCFVDLISKNFVLAAIVTFLFMRFIKSFRDSFGRSNLAKKTLVDERFLI
ncbi:meckelin-like isoform X2 [Anneissia japonica]|uniref:meckelin-like isoform X2 n=1 Tax=Anneissia japonica TaxID=1529436 RepID=UPI001425B03B|nr:meckelin-like isoform X2 [Anneissia japonica]